MFIAYMRPLGSFTRSGYVRRLARCLPGVAVVCGLACAAHAESELVLSSMTYVSSDAGASEVVLEATTARIEPGSDVARLEEVSLDAAGDDGESSLVMTCDRAELDLATSDFHADGNVVGRTADGHRFTTGSATFEHGPRVIHTDARAQIVDPTGTRLTGQGFRYDVRARRMIMRKAVVDEAPGEEQPR